MNTFSENGHEFVGLGLGKLLHEGGVSNVRVLGRPRPPKDLVARPCPRGAPVAMRVGSPGIDRMFVMELVMVQDATA